VHADKLKKCYGDVPKSWLNNGAEHRDPVAEIQVEKQRTAEKQATVNDLESAEQSQRDSDEEGEVTPSHDRQTRQRKLPAHFRDYRL
jgi:hypothetical protein